MKRYQIGEKVKLIPVPNKYWGMEAVYEPFERVRVKGKSGWMIVQRQENKKITFFLENIYTGKQESFVSEDSGIESWEKIKKHLDYYETMPPEYRMQQQQPQPGPGPQPGLQIEQLSQTEKKLNEQLERMNETIEKSNIYMEERDAAFNYELMLQRFDAIKESFFDFEQKLQAAKPKISLEQIREREAGQTKISNDVEKPADPDA